MNRREAISTVGLIIGGTVIGAEAFLSGCSTKREDIFFGDADIHLLNEIGETIIPETPGVPGAREAKVGEFMKVFVSDCYTNSDIQIFKNGLTTFRSQCETSHGKTFENLDAQVRHQFLLELEVESSNYKSTKTPEDPDKHYYSMFKQMTILGFLTSEPGATKALRNVPVPGRFDACIPLEKGQKAWS